MAANRIPPGMSITTCCFVVTVVMMININHRTETAVKMGLSPPAIRPATHTELVKTWIDGNPL